jgi:hypothetical protein
LSRSDPSGERLGYSLVPKGPLCGGPLKWTLSAGFVIVGVVLDPDYKKPPNINGILENTNSFGMEYLHHAKQLSSVDLW